MIVLVSGDANGWAVGVKLRSSYSCRWIIFWTGRNSEDIKCNKLWRGGVNSDRELCEDSNSD